MDQPIESKDSTISGFKLRLRKLSLLSNKYLLALLAFCIWMLFFDRNDFFSQGERISRSAELKYTEQKKLELIAETRKELNLLKTNTYTIEKYAREKYLMKKDNEDLFLFSPVGNSK